MTRAYRERWRATFASRNGSDYVSRSDCGRDCEAVGVNVDEASCFFVPRLSASLLSPIFWLSFRYRVDLANTQLIKWYQERKLPLTLVRPPSDKFDNSKPVEGLKVVENIVRIA